MFALDGDERAEFLKQINPIDGKYSTSPETTAVGWRILPFYKETVKLVRVRDMGWPIPHLTIYYLSHKNNLYRLNGTSPPIHEANKRARIRLTDENFGEYVRFFFWFVRSEEGPFALVEQVPADLEERYRAAIKDLIDLTSSEDEPGGFKFGAAVWFSGRLVSVVIEVRPDGMVAMIEGEVIATDFSVGGIEPIA